MNSVHYGNEVDSSIGSRSALSVLPSEFVIAAGVRSARIIPQWLSRRRWLVLRGFKSPILSVYRQDARRRGDCVPVRIMLLGDDTRIRVVDERGLVLISSRVRTNEVLSLVFQSVGERDLVHGILHQWIALARLLQRLSSHEVIAKGPNSVVYRCNDRDDPTKNYVLKRMHRSRCHRELSMIEHLMALPPDNTEVKKYLARYAFLFEDRKAKYVSMLMEYYPSGSLADRIHEHGRLDEGTACTVLLSLCRALHLLHEKQVLHLDVKASNILFDNESGGDFCNLKLIDFGSGAFVDSTGKVTVDNLRSSLTSAGTYGCMAPERFEGCCGPEADIYGAGIVLYHMITGVLPFVGVDAYQTMVRNMHGEVSFDAEQWRHISPPLKSLAAKMLDKDPTSRITLSEVLNLSWLRKRAFT